MTTVPPPLTPAALLHHTLPEPTSVLRVTSTDGTSLHSQAHGPDGAPTVVLAHGWTCSSLFWAPVTRRLLAQGFRVVLYDLRGHGQSARPHRRGYSTTALADDLETVLRAQVPQGTAAVVGGHSLGAMSILACANRPVFRDKTAAALLASTGSQELMDGLGLLPIRNLWLRRRLHRMLATSLLPLGPANALNRWLLRLATMGATTTREQAMFCARIVTRCGVRPRAAWGRVLTTLDVAADIAHLTMPTSVLVGTADRLTPPPHSEVIVSRLPRVEEFVKLPGVGHMTPVERPDEVTSALSRLAKAHLPAASERIM